MADETPVASTVTTATDSAVKTATAIKPGWKTSEFWLKNAATLLSILFITNTIPTGGTIEKVAIIAALELGSFGYTVARTMAKAAA